MVHIYHGILLSHRKNTFEPVLMKWMNLEPITQNKVSQKILNIILIHIFGIWKDGADEPIFRAAMEMQREQTCGYSRRRRELKT